MAQGTGPQIDKGGGEEVSASTLGVTWGHKCVAYSENSIFLHFLSCIFRLSKTNVIIIVSEDSWDIFPSLQKHSCRIVTIKASVHRRTEVFPVVFPFSLSYVSVTSPASATLKMKSFHIDFCPLWRPRCLGQCFVGSFHCPAAFYLWVLSLYQSVLCFFYLEFLKYFSFLFPEVLTGCGL